MKLDLSIPAICISDKILILEETVKLIFIIVCICFLLFACNEQKTQELAYSFDFDGDNAPCPDSIIVGNDEYLENSYDDIFTSDPDEYGDNGYSGTSKRIGDYSYSKGYDNKGNSYSGTTNRIGNYTYSNGYDSKGNSYFGTTNRIGNYTYSNGYDSKGNSYSSTTNRIGN